MRGEGGNKDKKRREGKKKERKKEKFNKKALSWLSLRGFIFSAFYSPPCICPSHLPESPLLSDFCPNLPHFPVCLVWFGSPPPPHPFSAEVPARAVFAVVGRGGRSTGLQRGAQRASPQGKTTTKKKIFIFKKCHLQSVHIIWTPQYYIHIQDIKKKKKRCFYISKEHCR